MDTGGTVEIDGRVFWTFGDTVLAGADQIPNHIAWSDDDDASGCIRLRVDDRSGTAVPLLPYAPGDELSVWPLGMEETSADTVHFYYASVVEDPQYEWRVQGVGIGSFDTETLVARRELGGELLWTAGTPMPTRTFSDGEYVYTFQDITRETWTRDTILARVPVDDIESPAAYEYWDGKVWLAGLWDAEAGAWSDAIDDIEPLWRQGSMHNGVEVAYNEFLDTWLAVYSTGFMSGVNVRTADDLTGPWEGETVLVDCSTFHSQPDSGFLCYSGAQHESYTADGGRTIYVSYSNEGSYQPYLHEIRLAAPVDGPAGLALYASDIPAPGLAPIFRWRHVDGGATRYGAAAPWPAGDYENEGLAFFAPVDEASAREANALHAPVYQWSRGDTFRYSPLNLAPAGYAQERVAFYAPCPDADGDSLTDCFESFLGTDPAHSDSDGDGLTDGYELATAGCEPLVFDSDADGVPGPEEVFLGRNPCRTDDVEHVRGR